jgi:hypothetical protein
MKLNFFAILLILLVAAATYSQDFTDEDKRGFDDLTPIKIDVDGDGIKDTIKPRIYKVKPSRPKDKKLKPSDIQHWIAFDLTTGKGLKIRAFFKYRYGNDEAAYWVYVLKSVSDVNKDGKKDLIFYAGDDTSAETVWLVNRKNRFVIYKRETSTSDS